MSNAVGAGSITAEQAASRDPKDLKTIRDLVHAETTNTEPNAALRATPAQATFNGVLDLRAGRRVLPAAEVEKVQKALVDRGFLDADAAEAEKGRVGRATEQATRTLIGAYRGVHTTAETTPTLMNGDIISRVLFGSSEGPGGVKPEDALRWVHVQEGHETGVIHPVDDNGKERPTSLWGTQRTANAIYGIVRELRKTNPDAEILMNDMSSRTGGRFPPHVTHQIGSSGDLDFKPEPSDKAGAAQWLADRQAELRAIKAQPFVQMVGTTNPQLLAYGRKIGLKMAAWSRHETHFHIETQPYNGSEERNAEPRRTARAGRRSRDDGDERATRSATAADIATQQLAARADYATSRYARNRAHASRAIIACIRNRDAITDRVARSTCRARPRVNVR